MELSLNIDPEQINKMVAEAVLNSAIGGQVQEAVKRVVRDLSTTYNNPIDGVVKQHISEMAVKILMKDHRESIEAKVREAIAEKLTGEFIGNIIESGWKHR